MKNWQKIFLWGTVSLHALGGGLYFNSFAGKTENIKKEAYEPVVAIERTVEEVKNNDLYDMIARHEGIRNTAYDDSMGVRTIGIGFNLEKIGARERIEKLGFDYNKIYSGKQSINVDVAYKLMEDDIEIATSDARKYIGSKFDELPKKAQNVLIDMSYNLGYTRLSKFKNLRKEIIEGDFDDAADEMENSLWFKQVGNRSKNLVGIMRSLE